MAGVILATPELAAALVGGRPILDRLVEIFLAVLDRVIVIETRTNPPTYSDPRITVIPSRTSDELHAVLCAIEVLRTDVKGVVFQSIVSPLTTESMIRALLEGDGSRFRLLVHEGRAGRPIYAPSNSFEDFLDSPEGGLLAVLAERDVELVEWPDSSVLAELGSDSELFDSSETH